MILEFYNRILMISKYKISVFEVLALKHLSELAVWQISNQNVPKTSEFRQFIQEDACLNVKYSQNHLFCMLY